MNKKIAGTFLALIMVGTITAGMAAGNVSADSLNSLKSASEVKSSEKQVTGGSGDSLEDIQPEDTAETLKLNDVLLIRSNGGTIHAFSSAQAAGDANVSIISSEDGAYIADIAKIQDIPSESTVWTEWEIQKTEGTYPEWIESEAVQAGYVLEELPETGSCRARTVFTDGDGSFVDGTVQYTDSENSELAFIPDDSNAIASQLWEKPIVLCRLDGETEEPVKDGEGNQLCIGLVTQDCLVHVPVFDADSEITQPEISSGSSDNGSEDSQTVSGSSSEETTNPSGLNKLSNDTVNTGTDSLGKLPIWVWIIVGICVAELIGLIVCISRIALTGKKRTGERGKNKGDGIYTQAMGEDFSQSLGETELVHSVIHNIGRRKGQQDSFGVQHLANGNVLAVVADGMGGLENSDRVSRQIVHSFISDAQKFLTMEPGKGLLSSLMRANISVNNLLGTAPGKKPKSGSTVLAVLAGPDGFHWLSVGDSRIYLIHKGSIYQINREHTYESELHLKAVNREMTFAEMDSVPKKNGLTSFVGMGQLRYVDESLHKVQAERGDKLLLMTDGVFNDLSDNEILTTVEQAENIDRAAESLEQLVLFKNNLKQDNFTCVLIDFAEKQDIQEDQLQLEDQTEQGE